MKFDYIIMNPPYGERKGSVAKEIIDRTIEMVDKNLIVLAPIRSSQNQISHISNIKYLGNANNYFTAKCPALSINVIESKEVNVYKDLVEARLNKKQLYYLEKVKEYNKTHKPFYKGLHNYCNLTRKEELKDVPEELLFVVTTWCPADKVHKEKSEDRDHNLDHLPINWREMSMIYTIEFSSKVEIDNFTKWWYRIPGKSPEAQKTLIYFILDILSEGYNGGPSIRKYPIAFPNLDWTYPWTDEEILEEINITNFF